MASDAITLPDGRRLRWHEFGDPDGAPVIYTTGTSVTGLGGVAYDETARAAGLRWIAPDKPGYGGSDYQRNRSLTSWGEDLAVLADHLGLDRFALTGESSGGPFTLGAAHRLAGRATVAVLIAPAWLSDPGDRTSMKTRMQVVFWLGQHAPALNAIPVAALRWRMVSPARRERALQRELAATPRTADAAATLRTEYEAIADALQPGTRGTVQEFALLTRLRAFPVNEVTTPVHVWHGALDRDVPVACAHRLARELPDVTLHVSETSGHDVGRDRTAEIMSVLASYASTTQAKPHRRL